MSTLLIGGSTFGQYETPSDLPKVEKQPVVALVNTAGGHGSAVAIRQIRKQNPKSCYEEFITVAHVSAVDHTAQVYTPAITLEVFNGHQKGKVVVLYMEHQWDLALIATTNPECMVDRAMGIKKGYIQAGKPVWAAGWLNKYGPTGSYGSITSYEVMDTYDPNIKGPFLAHSAGTFPGMSGGALIYKGKLVGVLAGAHESKHNWNLAVPAWRVQQFLADYRGHAKE